jgi:hypothetical protein
MEPVIQISGEIHEFIYTALRPCKYSFRNEAENSLLIYYLQKTSL